MSYFVWPASGLRSVPGNPRRDQAVQRALMASREAQLEQLRDEILAALAPRISDRDAARRSTGVYPGTGQLLFDDAFVNREWLRDYTRQPIIMVPDTPLPEMQMLKGPERSTPATQWHLTRIDAPAGSTGNGIKIGVIDIGLDTSMPDFPLTLPVPCANYDPGPPAAMVPGAPLSPDFHGTAVTAFLAGKISGVAKGAQVFVAVLPMKTVTKNQSMITVALHWLNAVIGCDIITTSMFTGGFGDLPTGTAYSPWPSLSAVDYALQQTQLVSLAVVTAAIGNNGAVDDIQHPGNSAYAIGVGAVNKADQWQGSAFGEIAPGVHKPDIVAPGYQLEFPNTLTTHKVCGGTSFAAPIVAGAAALLMEKYPALKGDPPALWAKLSTRFTPVAGAPANSTGVGRLDLKGTAM